VLAVTVLGIVGAVTTPAVFGVQNDAMAVDDERSLVHGSPPSVLVAAAGRDG